MEKNNIMHLGLRSEAVSFYKRFILSSLFLISLTVTAQVDVSIDRLRSMPESELIKYYNQAKSQGYSENQIIELARLKGASPSEIAELKEKFKLLKSTKNPSTTADTDTISELNETPFGIQPGDSNAIDYSPVYGADFFTNPKVVFTPSLNLATPASYQLGPGDTIAIELWGASANTFVKEISKSGTISIEGIAPVYLSGSTLSRAKQKLTQALSNIYQGLTSEDPTAKISIAVDLQSARTIMVQIVGQAKVPGTYALSGFSNPIHGLYASGGITFNGSYRNIELKRAGRTIETIDLYDYFSSGNVSLRLLRDGDVLFIPYYSDRVQVMGAVKKRGLFELKNGEPLSKFLTHFGGFLPSADPSALLIDRKDGPKRNILSVSETDFKIFSLQNADRITAIESFPSYNNIVTIQGAVVSPGDFSFTTGMHLGDLISLADGLQKNAVSAFATLYRQKDGIERLIESVGLSDQELEATLLEKGDRVLVYAADALEAKQQITIEGEIQNPGDYDFYDGMALQDLIATSGGLKAKANEKNIAVYSIGSDLKYYLKNSAAFSLTASAADIRLNASDIVVVGINPLEVNPEFVTVDGQVKNPGKYLLDDISASPQELIARVGLKAYASSDGIYILRKKQSENKILRLQSSAQALENTIDEIQVIAQDLNKEDAAKIEKNQQESKDDFIKIPVEFTQKKILPTLEADDILVVEKQKNDVMVEGGVIQVTALAYKGDLNRSAKSYINSAGGFSQRAHRKRVFVIHQNGRVSSTKNLLLFKIYPRVSPGSKVIVPEKAADRKRASFQEIMGVSTALATFGIIIDRLLQ